MADTSKPKPGKEAPHTSALSDGRSGHVHNKALQDLLILLIDVDQGECTLVIERHNGAPRYVAVIDGGYSISGRGALIRYVEAFGIEVINDMICTHFDRDHADGLLSFLDHHEEILINNLYLRHVCPAAEALNTVQRRLIKTAEERGIRLTQAAPPEVLKQPTKESPLQIDCITSLAGPLFDENEGSIALLLSYGGFTYYTAGDLPSHREENLISPISDRVSGRPLSAMKCGHHGSDGSTPGPFLDALKPAWAFISCGRQAFGHPSYGVIERLAIDNSNSSVQKIYLTNCFHNRRSINTDYEVLEQELWSEYSGKLREACSTVNDLVHDFHPLAVEIGDIDAESPTDATLLIDEWKAAVLESEISDKERVIEKCRTARRYASAAKRAREHFGKQNLRSGLGIVAGSDNELGTIVIHVRGRTETLIEAGCFRQDEGRWRWDLHQSSKGLPNEPARDQIEETLREAIWAEGVPTTATSSPQKFSGQLDARQKQYIRFASITVTGLHEPTRGAPFVPFCFYCREEDDRTGLIHQLCANCEDDNIYYHPGCLEEREGFFAAEQVKRLRQLTESPPPGTIEDLELDPQLCPICHGAEEMPKKERPTPVLLCGGCSEALGKSQSTLRCYHSLHKKIREVNVCKICAQKYERGRQSKKGFACTACSHKALQL